LRIEGLGSALWGGLYGLVSMNRHCLNYTVLLLALASSQFKTELLLARMFTYNEQVQVVVVPAYSA